VTTDTRLEKITLAFSLVLPCVASLALMLWAPGRITPTTYVMAASFALGTTTVALNTWKSSRATGSIGQLLYETNAGIRPDADENRRYEILAMMVPSAITTATIVAAWLS
jgi:hypothetical protein